MENLGYILKIIWAVIKFLFKKKEEKDVKVKDIKKEIDNAFKIKDKRKKASAINNIIARINRV